jgi:hypothetical protein
MRASSGEEAQFIQSQIGGKSYGEKTRGKKGGYLGG